MPPAAKARPVTIGRAATSRLAALTATATANAVSAAISAHSSAVCPQSFPPPLVGEGGEGGCRPGQHAVEEIPREDRDQEPYDESGVGGPAKQVDAGREIIHQAEGRRVPAERKKQHED
jgi:hypothetical protein